MNRDDELQRFKTDIDLISYCAGCGFEIAAVIAPDILMHQEVIDVTWHNRALIASVIAGGAFVWRQSLVLTIVVGMLVFTALRLLEIGG